MSTLEHAMQTMDPDALEEAEDSTAEALFRAADGDYTGTYMYDDGAAFQRKCVWALADIGSPRARGFLEELARTGREPLAGYARRRLDRWDLERVRKAYRGG